MIIIKDTRFPRRWHPSKNLPDLETDFGYYSTRKAWWLCDNGHETFTYIQNVHRGRNCSYCMNRQVCPDNSLAILQPLVASQWHPTKNAKLTPHDVVAYSGRSVWWKCPKGQRHEWKSPIQGRTMRQHGCPYCVSQRVSLENCLATLKPTLAKQWHHWKNNLVTPNDVTAYSGKPYWWQCPKKKSHDWRATVLDRSYGRGCPHCSRINRKAGKFFRPAIRKIL